MVGKAVKEILLK